MSQSTDRNTTLTEPLTPTAEDGLVIVVDRSSFAMDMTADAAEISGLRFLKAASRAREKF